MPVTEQWVTKEDMAEAIKKAKTTRKSKLSAFTRTKKRLDTLLEGNAEEGLLREVYTELSDNYRILETKHEELCLLLDEEDLDAEDNYLDGSSDVLSQMQLLVNKTIKERAQKDKASTLEAEKKKQFDGQLALLKASIQNFGQPSTTLSNLSAAKTISFADMRLEMEKIEACLSNLEEEKKKTIDMDPSADLTAVYEQFNNLVVTEVSKCKSIALEYIKDAPTVEAASVHGGGGSRPGFSSTKRETVLLPKFR